MYFLDKKGFLIHQGAGDIHKSLPKPELEVDLLLAEVAGDGPGWAAAAETVENGVGQHRTNID